MRVTAVVWKVAAAGLEVREQSLWPRSSSNGRKAGIHEPFWRSQGHGHAGRTLPQESILWIIFFTQCDSGWAQICRPLWVSKLQGRDAGEMMRQQQQQGGCHILPRKLGIYEPPTVCRDAFSIQWLSIYEPPAVCKHIS